MVEARQLAAFLARLHTLNAVPDLSPLLEVQEPLCRPDDSLCETLIRSALRGHDPMPTPERPAVLHGDFWPGNTLWHGGQLRAVIDWEDTCTGHPLYDVGIARLELLFFHGQDIMRAFTDEYQCLTSVDDATLPYWDLRAALRPCGLLGDWELNP